MKTLLSGAVAVALAIAALPASAQQDEVKRIEGADLKGKVSQATYQTVIISEGPNKTTTLKGADVTGIIFGDQPPSFPRAINAWNEQKVDKAATLFEEALKEIDTKKLRALNKAPVLYQWGLFLAERGKPDEALALLKRVRTECGDSWWRPESYRKSFDIAKAKGADAQKSVLDEMRVEPEPLGSEAEMKLADMALAGSNLDEAIAIYRKVAGNATSTFAEAAKLGIFRCLKTQGNKSELEAFSQKLLADRATSATLLQAAAAWMAGATFEKAGKDKAKLRDAVIAAAKAIAMGPPERKEEAEDYVAALRVAAKAYAALGAEDPKAERKQEYIARATGYLMEIVRSYKGTPWAEAAQLELQTLGVKEN